MKQNPHIKFNYETALKKIELMKAHELREYLSSLLKKREKLVSQLRSARDVAYYNYLRDELNNVVNPLIIYSEELLCPKIKGA